MKPVWGLLTMCIALTAFAAAPKVMNGMLVDEHGMTLYVFDKDTTPGQSVCMGGCASKWPVAVAAENDKASGDWSIIQRSDGKHQWAYKGHPLYRWSMDMQAGDAKGDGIGGIWHVAKP